MLPVLISTGSFLSYGQRENHPNSGNNAKQLRQRHHLPSRDLVRHLNW